MSFQNHACRESIRRAGPDLATLHTTVVDLSCGRESVDAPFRVRAPLASPSPWPHAVYRP